MSYRPVRRPAWIARITSNLARAERALVRGTGVANRQLASRALILLVACSLSQMGCIVRDLDYESPANLPASVHSTPESPMSMVRVVDLDAPIGGDGGASTGVPFVATVRDANVGQTLYGLIYLDRNPVAPSDRSLIGDVIILPEQDEDPHSRRVAFEVPRADLVALDVGCHWVELLVTSELTGISNPRPADPTDVGIGVWWLMVVNDATPTVGMDGCPLYGDGGE